MKHHALTDLKIKAAKPKEKEYPLYDGDGLYILVKPSGIKGWRFAYMLSRKRKLMSMGIYPEVTLLDARERASDARKLIANGVDPQVVREAQKTAKAEASVNTFEAVAREMILRGQDKWAKTHIKPMVSRLEREVFPYIGKKPVTEIVAADIQKIAQRLVDRKVIETAHRVFFLCGQVLRYAVATGRLVNVCTNDLPRGLFPNPKEKHHAAPTKPEDVARLMRAIHAYEGGVIVRCALKLAPLVFVRPGELRKMEWKDIDLDEKEWRFVFSKQKNGKEEFLIVPLAWQAVEILKEIKPFTGEGRYVFPGARTQQRPMSENALTVAFRAMGYTGDELTAHGLRAMARTMLRERLKINPEIIEKQLGHKTKETLGEAYDRCLFLEDRQKMMQEWADYLDHLKNEVVRPGKVA